MHRNPLIAVGLGMLLGPVNGALAAADAADTMPFSERVEKARALRQQGELEAALDRIDQALAQQRAPAALIAKARILATGERPAEALALFDEAAQATQAGSAYWRIGLFGAARMHIWLGRYRAAEKNYRRLLDSGLDQSDRVVARAGLIKALTLQNRPRYAYRHVVEPDAAAHDRVHHALARAALWAGWEERARRHLAAVKSPPPAENWRGREFAELRAQVQRRRANPLQVQYDFYDDSDQLQSHTLTATAGRRLDPALTLSASLAVERFVQNGRRLTARRAHLAARGRLTSALTYAARVGIGDYDPWTTALWSGEVTYRADDEWGLQGFVAREAVETFTSFDQRNRFTLIGAAYDFKLHPRWVAALIPYAQDFSDGNLRKALRARVVGTLSERKGLILEIESRQFSNDKTDTQGYFNPESFVDIRTTLRWRRRHEQWTYELRGGPGYQWIEPGEDNATMLIEARLRGPLSQTLLLEARAGFSDAAADTSGGFSHRYATIQIARPWR